MGARIVEVSLPSLERANAISKTTLLTEATATYLPVLRGGVALAATLRRRLQSGMVVPGPLYVHGQRARAEVTEEVRLTMRDVDAVVTPTVPVVAPSTQRDEAAPAEEYVGAHRDLTDFTRLFNLTGQPALAIPCGFSRSALPLSLQVAGRRLEDGIVLRIGHAYQKATDWHLRQPPAADQEFSR
jgi:aspartyl-tRNA(Asn)/glutamyl-tRNA(Gln) amidotransferase subunit A